MSEAAHWDSKRWQQRRESRQRTGLWCAGVGAGVLVLLGACEGGPRQEATASAGAAPIAPASDVAAAVPATAPPRTPSRGPSKGEAPPPPERAGVCAQLQVSLASGGSGLRYFAEVTPQQQGAPMQWAEVRSRAEADERSPEGTALELWSVAEREGWRLAVLSGAAVSGGSASESELCFRPNGSLAQLRETSGKRVVAKISDLPFASLLEPAR